MKILIIRLSSFGDVVMASVLPRVIKDRYPDAEVDFIVRKDFYELIRHNPKIREKISFDIKEGVRGLYKLSRWINRQNYDFILDVHKKRWSILLKLFVHKKITHFDRRIFKRLLLCYLKINLFKKRPDSQLMEFVKPLRELDISYNGEGTELFIPDATKDSIKKRLASDNSSWGCRKKIALIPSAFWPKKRWPVEYFAKLAGLLQDNSDVIILGGANDQFCYGIAAPYTNTRCYAGKFSKLESIAAICDCDLVIGNDTGLIHAAEAVGKDVIVILGPTSGHFGCTPFRKGSKVIEVKEWCRPCSTNGSGICLRFGTRPCLYKITPEMVFREIR